MPFIWTRQLQHRVVLPVEQESVQTVFLPTYDKISDIEHKNGKFMDGTRQEDNEVGRWEKEVDGKEVVLPCVEDSKEHIQEERRG